MAEVVFDHVTLVSTGNDKPSVDDLNMDIKGRRVPGVLVGPVWLRQVHYSVCSLAFEEVNKGRILIGGDATMQPKDRDIVMVFQNLRLYST